MVTTLTILLVWTAGLAPATAQESKYAGRPVADVLRELQTPELRIIFSSDLVPPALRVKNEPTSRNAREIAMQILAPHGLTLQKGPRALPARRRDGPFVPRVGQSRRRVTLADR